MLLFVMVEIVMKIPHFPENPLTPPSKDPNAVTAAATNEMIEIVMM
jgi:hypothetical protein